MNTEPAFNPGVAGVLSLVIPGAGQIYRTRVASGLAWLLAVASSYVLLLPLGLILHVACIIAASRRPAPPQQDGTTDRELGVMVAAFVALLTIGWCLWVLG